MMRKKVLGISLAAALTFSFATVASADGNPISKSNDVEAKIKAGEFSLDTPSIQSFGDIILKSEKESYTTSFDGKFKVKDLRGSQEGWRLDVSAGQFDNGNHKLPKGSLAMEPLHNIDRVEKGSGDKPVISMNSNEVIDDGTVEVAKAKEGAGMGVFDLSFNSDALALTVDATTAKTGTYTSTLTWDLVQAP